MIKNLNVQAARWGLEILVIALGIILAISAESLWQEHLNRQEEIQHLIALADDFEGTLSLLEERVSKQNNSSEALRRLLQGAADSAAPVQVRAWIRDGLFGGYYFEPQLSALQDLVQSGKMELLQVAELRRALAELLQKAGHFEIFLSSYIRTQENLIDSYLVSHFDLALSLNLGDAFEVAKNTPLEFDPSIFESIELRSRIAIKLSLRRSMQNHQAEIKAQLEAILEMIRSQLESGQLEV